MTYSKRAKKHEAQFWRYKLRDNHLNTRKERSLGLHYCTELNPDEFPRKKMKQAENPKSQEQALK